MTLLLQGGGNWCEYGLDTLGKNSGVAGRKFEWQRRQVAGCERLMLWAAKHSSLELCANPGALLLLSPAEIGQKENPVLE